jgi:hypothetical protein
LSADFPWLETCAIRDGRARPSRVAMLISGQRRLTDEFSARGRSFV